MQNLPRSLFHGVGGAEFISDTGTWGLNQDSCDADDCWWGLELLYKGSSIQANLLGAQAPYSLEVQLDEDSYLIWDKKVQRQ